MCRFVSLFCASVALVVIPAIASAGDLKGDYLETRTCDVYTGPCFANGQVGLTGKDAIMAWSIDRGTYEDVDLAGLKVVVVINASDTLGFGGGLVSVSRPDQIGDHRRCVGHAATARRAGAVRFAICHPRRRNGEDYFRADPNERGPFCDGRQIEGRIAMPRSRPANWPRAIACAATSGRFIPPCAT